jgi:hypothetical protein
MLPNNFPRWEAVYQQAQRWIKADVFMTVAQDLRVILRTLGEREPQPTAAIIDSRTLRGTPESGHRAEYDGHKRKKGSKVHIAVDTLGHLLALAVTPANTMIGLRSPISWRRCRRSPVKVLRSPMSIRAIPARRRPLLRRSTEFNWRWSNFPRPSAALCYRRDAGLSAELCLGDPLSTSA